MLCKNCGTDVDQYAKVCVDCSQPTGFLNGLDGKQKPDCLGVLARLNAADRNMQQSDSETVICKQCGFENIATSEVCSLCGCMLKEEAMPEQSLLEDNSEGSGRLGIAALFLPENKKKLIITAVCAAEVFLILLVIILAVIFSGKAKNNGNSTVSLNYVDTSAGISSEESSYPVISAIVPSMLTSSDMASSGLTLSDILSSEGMLSSSSALTSSMGTQPVTSSNPGGYQIIINNYSSPTSSTATAPESDTTTSSTVSHATSSEAPQESSAPSSKPTSSKTTSSKNTSSQTASSNPTSSKTTSSKNTSSAAASSEETSSQSVIVIE